MSFDKMFVFCGKFCVRSNKFVSILIKIKCVNSGNISDICDKLNVTTNYTRIQKLINILSKYTQITNFDTFDGIVMSWDLSISAKQHVMKDFK